MAKRVPIFILLSLLLSVAIANMGDVVRDARDALALYRTATATNTMAAEPLAAPVRVGALGQIEPASRVRKIAPPASISVNRVDRLLVEEGDDVTSGQLLAEFADAAQKQAAVAQADAAIAEAQAELTLIRAAGRPDDIDAQRERIAGLGIQETIARQDAARADALVPSGAGTRAAAERADAAANRAAADLREAEDRLVSLSTPRPEDVAVAEARVQRAIAAGARARADAALSEIRAPISGKVLKIYARAGDIVGPDGLLDLADLDRMEVVADVYETDLPRVRVGARAEVTVPGTTDRYPAKVRKIGWMVKRALQAGTDPTAAVDGRTVEVRLTLGSEGAASLRQRINAQVDVAIEP